MEHLFKLQKEKNARVFVSSTFRDMMNEREHLVKDVFPMLREQMLAKGISFAEVDLRWGITEQEATEGRVVEICLDEIERSKPYFIGIIGERYGWAPGADEEAILKRLEEKFPWAKADLETGMSITEMEIQFGVLRDPHMHPRSFFYIKETDSAAGQSEDTEKLLDLKKRLKTTPGLNVRTYSGIEQLGAMVTEDLRGLLSKDFPEEAEANPLMEINKAQNAFLNKFLHHYVRQAEVFEAFSEKSALAFNPVYLTGNQGIGKTALLANWIEQIHRDNPRRPVLYRFLDASPELHQAQALVRNICQELMGYFKIEMEIPKNPAELYAFFQKLPDFIDPSKEIIIVIDGLENIIHAQKEAPFQWLPDSLNPNMKLVVSADEGPLRELFMLKGYDFFEMPELQSQGIEFFARQYLGFFGKSLDVEVLEGLKKFKLSSNPLFLKALLEEIRMYGSFETLGEFLNAYASCEDMDAFFRVLIMRLQSDADKKREGLTSVLLSTIKLSRRGVSESELLALGAAWYKEGIKIPHLYWSPVLAACGMFMHRRDGLLSFANQRFASIVQEMFLADEGRSLRMHQLMAAWFSIQPLEKRSMDELPWHLAGSGNWEGLHQYLSLPSVFRYLFMHHMFELADLWTKLSKHYSISETYLQWLDEFESGLFEPLEKASYLAMAGNLAFFAGLKDEAVKLIAPSFEIYASAKGLAHADTVTIGKLLAGTWLDLAEAQKSATVLEQLTEALEKEDADSPELPALQSMQADIFHFLGQNQKAEHLYQQSIEKLFANPYADANEIIDAVNNLGHLFYKQAKYQQAEDLYKKAVNSSILNQGANHHFTAAIFLNLGELYRHTFQWEPALEYTTKALEIREQLFGSTHPSTANLYNNISMLYYDMGDMNQALSFALKAYEIRNNFLGVNHPQTITVVNNLASIYRKTGELDKAIEYQRQALEGRRKIFPVEHPAVSYTANQLAVFYLEQKDAQNALVLLEPAYLNQKSNPGLHHPDTLSTMSNLALCYELCEMPEKSMEILLQAAKGWEQSEAAFGPSHFEFLNNLAISLYNQDKTEALLEQVNVLFESWKKARNPQQSHFAKSMEILHALQNTNVENKALIEIWEKAIEVVNELFAENLKLWLVVHNTFAEILSACHLFQEAAGIYEGIIETIAGNPGFEQELLNAKINLATQLSRMNRAEEADKIFEAMLNETAPGEEGLLTRIFIAKPFAEHKMATHQYAEALELLHQAADWSEKLPQAVPAASSRIYGLLGEVQVKMGEYEKALNTLQKALEDYSKFAQKDGMVSSAYYHHMGVALFNLQQHEKAQEALMKSVEIYGQHLHEKHPLILDVCFDLAWNYYALGEVEKAQTLHEGVLNNRMQVLGEQHSKSHESLFAIARLLYFAENIGKAVQVLMHAIDLRIKSNKFETDLSLRMLIFITDLLLEAGDMEKAPTFAEQAWLLCKDLYGEEDQETQKLHEKFAELK